MLIDVPKMVFHFFNFEYLRKTDLKQRSCSYGSKLFRMLKSSDKKSRPVHILLSDIFSNEKSFDDFLPEKKLLTMFAE